MTAPTVVSPVFFSYKNRGGKTEEGETKGKKKRTEGRREGEEGEKRGEKAEKRREEAEKKTEKYKGERERRKTAGHREPPAPPPPPLPHPLLSASPPLQVAFPVVFFCSASSACRTFTFCSR